MRRRRKRDEKEGGWEGEGREMRRKADEMEER